MNNKIYFSECKTLDEAKNLFRKLCFELHPDHNNGSDQEFVQMYKQFENFTPTTKREGDDNFKASEFYNTVKRFEGLNNILVSFVGSFIWLEDEANHEGSTRAQKENIKKVLLDGYNSPRFAFKRKKWYYSPIGYKQKFKSSKSFDEIKNTWGSKTYKPQEREQSRQLAY
jgi:hypothetical protein